MELDVGHDAFVTVVGPNGAGKTSLLRAITGTTPASGEVGFDGVRVDQMPAHERARLGIIHVPQGRHVFSSLTVTENLELGAYRREARQHRAESLQRVLELFPMLAERMQVAAGRLSGGQQQMVALGRALMGRPRLLLLDEPSLGLAPKVVDEVFDRIRDIRRLGGVSVLLVEQLATEALELCDLGYILEGGLVRASGPGDELLHHEAVQDAYLGAAL